MSVEFVVAKSLIMPLVMPVIAAMGVMMAARHGRERHGVELAMQALPARVRGMDQIAAVLDPDGDLAPAFRFQLFLKGLARLPVGQRRRTVMGLGAAQTCDRDDEG